MQVINNFLDTLFDEIVKTFLDEPAKDSDEEDNSDIISIHDSDDGCEYSMDTSSGDT